MRLLFFWSFLFLSIFIFKGLELKGQEKGEILLFSAPASKPKKEISKEETKSSPLTEKQEQTKQDLSASYKKKMIVVYIASGVCFIYLLLTRRSRKRRI